ncbi:hypothetical protein PO124_03875 [Bacillus licheniformis]|nr:hypothetical protein [Bacillus licheniformis]
MDLGDAGCAEQLCQHLILHKPVSGFRLSSLHIYEHVSIMPVKVSVDFPSGSNVRSSNASLSVVW